MEGGEDGSTSRPLPHAVLCQILDCLPSVDLIRFQVLTGKETPTGLILGASDGFWARAVETRLDRFLPSSAFFDGPPNPSNHTFDDVKGRERFESAAESGDQRLQQALVEAGLSGASWTWTVRDLRRWRWDGSLPVLVETRFHVAPGRAGFLAWAKAFQCDACGGAGAAERQCAGCGDLLCGHCTVRCGEDRPHEVRSGPRGLERERVQSKCAFGLCDACHEDSSLVDFPVDREDVYFADQPGLYAPVCALCPPTLLRCPLHVDCCILECFSCDDRRCMNHNHDEVDDGEPTYFPGISNCFTCNFTQCGRIKCEPRDRFMWYCVDGERFCGNVICSKCNPTSTCPDCRGHMIP